MAHRPDPSARHAEILERVLAKGSASPAELSEALGVSLMTIHRDLDELTRQGLVRKYRGGVSAMPSGSFESSSAFRERMHPGAKAAIAEAAIALVEPGMSIMLDDSTTALAVARLLPTVGPLTVATNYLPSIDLLKSSVDIDLIVLGGNYSRTHDSSLGAATVDAIEALRVDLAFLSTSAMTPEETFHQEPAIVQVKRPMIAAAAEPVLLMDASKLERRALHRLARTSDFARIILGPATAPELADRVAEHTAVTVAARATPAPKGT